MQHVRILAVGDFSPDITDILAHSDPYYENTKPGTTVEAEVFLCEWPDEILRLAECLSVEITDCGTHAIRPIVADMQGLTKLFGAQEVDKFIRLVAADFTFLFSFR